MNPVIHLVLQLIIGPAHGLVKISSGMTLDNSYFGTKIPLPNCSYRKQTGMSMFLTLGVTLLASTKEIKCLLSFQCTVGAPLWSAKVSMYLWIDLVFLTYLYMHLISPSVDSEAIAG